MGRWVGGSVGRSGAHLETPCRATNDRTASELIRQAMEEYCRVHFRSGGRLRDLRPVSLGKVKRPLTPEDDILEEMWGEHRG